MNKKEYSISLKDDKWLIKRKYILKRDGYKCSKCNLSDNLHVHHKIYIQKYMPWEYPNKYLITLCKSCHHKVHKENKIKTYIRDPQHKKIKKTIKKKFTNLWTAPTPISYEYIVESSILNLIGGSVKEVETVTVIGGSIKKRFISMEAAQNWVVKNKLI